MTKENNSGGFKRTLELCGAVARRQREKGNFGKVKRQHNDGEFYPFKRCSATKHTRCGG